MIGAALISVWFVPIWATRYLYVAWGMLSLFVAVTVGERAGESSWIPQIVLLAMLCAEGAFSVQTIRQSEMMTSTANQFVEFLDENVEAGAYVFLDDPKESAKIYGSYMPQAHFVITREFREAGGEEALRAALEQGQGGQMWYIINYTQVQIGTDRMREMLGQNGYEMEYAASFTIQERNLEIYRIGDTVNGK